MSVVNDICQAADADSIVQHIIVASMTYAESTTQKEKAYWESSIQFWVNVLATEHLFD